MISATVSEPQPKTVSAEGEDRQSLPAHSRVHVGEVTSVASALALLVALFATKWYGVAGVPDPSYARPAISTAENGWDGLTTVRWVVLATILVTLGSLFLHASQRQHGVRTDTSRVVTALGALTSALLAYRVLIALPGGGVIDQKLGAVLGLFCALGIAIGGIESIADHRARRPTARHRARAAAAGAAAATAEPEAAE